MITLEELIMRATYVHSSTRWRSGDVFHQESTDRFWFALPHINGDSNLVFLITTDFAVCNGLGETAGSIEETLSGMIKELKIDNKLEDIIRARLYL